MIAKENELSKQRFFIAPVLSLFASTGTLLCCALPALRGAPHVAGQRDVHGGRAGRWLGARGRDRSREPPRSANFPDAGGKLEYNTVDAALWYFEAIRQYFAATQDAATLQKLRKDADIKITMPK